MKYSCVIYLSLLTLLSACGGAGGGNAGNDMPPLSVTASPTYSLTPYSVTSEPINNSGPVFFDVGSNYTNLVTAGMDPAKLNSILSQVNGDLLSRFTNLLQEWTDNANLGRWRWGGLGNWNGFGNRGGHGHGYSQFRAYSNLVLQPSDVRSAYQMTNLTSSTNEFDQGAGQTIYIIDAYHHSNIASDLAYFNSRFGLPTCSNTTLSASAILPILSSTGGCTLTIAYANSTGGKLSNTAPVTNNSWATEIATDVEWAHATAPKANIVLIEAVDASLGSLVSAIQLANQMGPGIVSMSFATPEGSWATSYESSLFAGTGITYVAAAGDSGSQVNWPAVSSKVIAVGGTTLSWDGNLSDRNELAWSGSGGGISQYIPMPNYQINTGIGSKYSTSMRTVPDVAFNADPRSGQYVYITLPGARSGAWYVIGGTSIAAPQWSGILAVSYSQKIANRSTQPLNNALNSIYQYVGNIAQTYSSDLFDVTSGSDANSSTCTTCDARISYDLVTGWGTPFSTSSLLTTLDNH